MKGKVVSGFIALFLIVASSINYVAAQFPPARDTLQTVMKSPVSTGVATELYLSLGILLFGIILMAFEVMVILKKQEGWNTNAIKVVGLTLVIVAGLFLITAGYSESQIAPMVGLLGTIAGYLLGKSSRKED
jgi:glucan phosphoethanolaminetransferase (alkaline phosphatase superfamily)